MPPLAWRSCGWEVAGPATRLEAAATACAARAASSWHTPSPPGTSLVDVAGRTRTDPHPKSTRDVTLCGQCARPCSRPGPLFAPPPEFVYRNRCNETGGRGACRSPDLPTRTATARQVVWPLNRDPTPFNWDARVARGGEGAWGRQRARRRAPCETRDQIMTAPTGAADAASARIATRSVLGSRGPTRERIWTVEAQRSAPLLRRCVPHASSNGGPPDLGRRIELCRGPWRRGLVNTLRLGDLNVPGRSPAHTGAKNSPARCGRIATRRQQENNRQRAQRPAARHAPSARWLSVSGGPGLAERGRGGGVAARAPPRAGVGLILHQATPPPSPPSRQAEGGRGRWRGGGEGGWIGVVGEGG